MKLSRSHVVNATFHACLSVSLLGLMYWQFNLHGYDLNVPIVFDGDTMHFLATARTMIDSANWEVTDRLSAPFAFPFLAFPADGVLGRVFMRWLTWVTPTPGMAVNLQFLLELVLAGNLMAWCLRQLAVGRAVAFAAGVLYAMLPYNQVASTIHLMTIAVLAAPVLTWSVLLADPERLEGLRRRNFLLVLVSLSGLMSIYPAFFSAFCLAAGTLTGWLANRDRRALKWGVLALGCQVTVFFLGIAPGIAYWMQDPQTWAIIDGIKSPREADGAAPLLRHLLLPMSTHPFPPFAWIGQKMRLAGMPLDTGEAMRMAWLGTTGGVGLLGLLAVMAGFVPRRLEGSTRLLRQAGAVALALFLLSTAGGLGSVWNVLVSNQIRAYVRVVPFLAAVCVPMGVILLLALARRGMVRSAASVALVFLGTVDQSSTRYFPEYYPRFTKKFVELTGFVGQMEHRYQPGSAVFQLPWTPYPSTPQLHGMRADEHLAAHTVSRTMKWSWPAFTARSVYWQRHVSQLTGQDLCERLVHSGFEALWIDRSGYGDGGAALIATIEPLLGQPVFSYPDGHIVVYDLVQYGNLLRLREGQAEWGQKARAALHIYYQWGRTFRLNGSSEADSILTPVRGLSNPEESLFSWTDSREASFSIEVARPTQGDVRLELLTVPHGLIVDRMRMSVLVDECAAGERILVRGPESYSITIPARCIAGKGAFLLRLSLPDAISPLELGRGGDSRSLGIALTGLCLSETASNTVGGGSR